MLYPQLGVHTSLSLPKQTLADIDGFKYPKSFLSRCCTLKKEILGTYSIAGIHETLRQLAHSSFEYILTFTSGLLSPRICTGGGYTGIYAHQINFPPDQLPRGQLPTRSTSHQINSREVNFPPDQLPRGQLPPDQCDLVGEM